MPLPSVVIIGLPNVGKSTLFNKILRQKKALVHRKPGMTRDAISDIGEWENHCFEIIDTGGIFENPSEPLNEKVTEKALEFAEKGDLVLFVVDGTRLPLPWEEEVARRLKKMGKQTILVVNKVDARKKFDLTPYYSLGFEKVIPVSAEHNHGLTDLMDLVISIIPERPCPEVEALKILILGRPNVGKSSIVNRLAGKERIIVDEKPGTTRDVIDVEIKFRGEKYRLLDTAGIRKLSRTRDSLEAAGIIKAKKAIKQADVCLIVMDATDGPTHYDAKIAQTVSEEGKPMVLVVNKWDLIKADTAKYFKIRQDYIEKLKFVSFAPILFVSALTGRRISNIMEEIESVYKEGQKRIKTSELNRYLLPILRSTPPKTERGEEVKFFYAAQTGILPPTFVLFANRKIKLEEIYRRFIERKIREKWEFKGNPIRIKLRKK
ncbi:MAG: ribosome biogenesis GTPase Der [Candidatus Aminicenantes bacterium]|nr:ribosome biogenesis GTPase Der [Candidatus Aminicenantes bacterium]